MDPSTRPALGAPVTSTPAFTPRRPWLVRFASLLMLPREHGAWAMLLMPYLIGTAVAGWGGWASLLVLAAVLSPFCGSRSLELMAAPAANPEARERRKQAVVRLSIYLALGGTAAILLIYRYQRWALLALGGGALALLAAQLLLRRYRLDRTWPARLLSIAALSTTGPAAYYASSGALDRQAMAVWVVAFLYSGASVFYVRLLSRSQGKARPGTGAHPRADAERQLIAYLAFAFLAVSVLTATLWLPPLAGLAFIPLLVKIAWVSTRDGYHPTLKQIGMAELVHAALFSLLAAAVLSSWGTLGV